MAVILANTRQAREAEPYLAKFEDDWATGQILRQYINGKHKYENAKANGKVKCGGKRIGTSSADPVASGRSAVRGIEIERDSVHGTIESPSDGGDDDFNSDYEDEWTGIYDANADNVFGGGDGDEGMEYSGSENGDGEESD
jgi:hypothetical protein